MAKFDATLEHKIFALAWQGLGIIEICEQVGISHEAHRKRMKEGEREGKGEKWDYFRTWLSIKSGIGEGLVAVARTQSIKSYEYDENGNVTKEITDTYTFAPAQPTDVEAKVLDSPETEDQFDKIMEARRERLGLPAPTESQIIPE